MGENTSISWTTHSWSPWEGCTKVSPGCTNCYAASMNNWLRKGANWGPGAPRREYSDEHWAKPLKWNAKADKAGVPLRIFPSVCDPFDNEVDPAWRARFFALIDQTPWLKWQLLTKRVGNVRSMLPDRWSVSLPTNVWLGATVVNQEEANRDVPKLLALKTCVRWLSIEPMLGPIALDRIVLHSGPFEPTPLSAWANVKTVNVIMDATRAGKTRPAIDWVIVGAESGRQARPLNVEWVRSLVQQCKAAEVAVHVKQLGAVVLDSGMSSPGQHWPRGTVRKALPRFLDDDPGFSIALKHPKGGDLAEWPEDLRVRSFPVLAMP